MPTPWPANLGATKIQVRCGRPSFRPSQSDGGGSLQLPGVALGDPQVADHPPADKLGHRSHGLFHRDLRIHPVQVVQVDVIRAETRQ